MIGLQTTRELSHHHHGTAAIGAGGGTGGGIGDDLTGTALADIDLQGLLLPFRPFAARGGIPGHVVRSLLAELRIVGLEGLHLKFRIAVGTFHLLHPGAELDGAVTAGAFVLLKDCHK